jgi:uncharacterized SAM-binding protein YcdF (DUF218 family)
MMRAPSTMLRAVGVVIVTGFLVTAFTPLPEALVRRLLDAGPVRPADAIVVLGSGVSENGTLTRRSLQRAIHGILLYKRGVAPLLLFSGVTLPDRPREGDVRARLARELGVPETALLVEGDVQTTRDEARTIHASLAARGLRRIVLVSDALHLIRAGPLFAHEGFAVVAVPSDGPPDHRLAPEQRLKAMRELLAELVARLYGRILG